jgi:hypothetical protein
MTTGQSVWASRGRRFLVSAPGLIAPVVLLVLSIQSFVHESASYYSLPVAERMADGDPFSADAGMFFAGVGIAAALLLFLPPLLAGPPRRLRLWAAIVAIALQLLPLWIASDFARHGDARGWVALVLFAYVPVLVVVRLVRQAQAVASPGSLSHGTS